MPYDDPVRSTGQYLAFIGAGCLGAGLLFLGFLILSGEPLDPVIVAFWLALAAAVFVLGIALFLRPRRRR